MDSLWMNGNGTSEQLERLAAEIKAKAQCCKEVVQLATSQLMEAWVKIGELLAAARAQLPSDEQFGQWIVRHELDEVGNKNNRTTLRVIAAHRAEIEPQAQYLDSIPRTAQMFLEKINAMRQAFGQTRLSTTTAAGGDMLREHVGRAHQSLMISNPEMDEKPQNSAAFGNVAVPASVEFTAAETGARPEDEPQSALIIQAEKAEKPQSSAEVGTTDNIQSTDDAPTTELLPISTVPSLRSLQDLPAPIRNALARYGGNTRTGFKRIHAHGGKAFLRWLGDKIIAGEINPITNPQNLSACSFVPGLHHSFDGRNWLISRPDGKPFDRKMAERLMDEFDELKAAAQAGLTFDQYDFQQRTKAPKQTPPIPNAIPDYVPADAPLRRYANLTPPPLPTEAHLTDGTPLTPQPIVICGEQLWPGYHFDYADVYMVVHIVRDNLLPLYRDDATAEVIGRDISTMGTHFWERHWPKIGAIFSAVGIAIRAGNRKNPQPRHLWFVQMESWHQKCAD